METPRGQAVSIDLVMGDCVVVMQSMAPESVSVVTTSPPYNLGVKYRSGYNDNIPRAQYLDWCMVWLEGIKRVLEYKGSLFLNMGGKPSDPWPPFEVLNIAKIQGFHLQNIIYWFKSLSLDGEPVIGHVKPINSGRFLTDAVEHVFHLTKTGDVELNRLAVGVPFAHKGNITRDNRGKNGDNRCPGNVWHIPYETIQSRDKDRPHPATFPPALAARCFKRHGLTRIKMTMDPFSGLGSSARAAKMLGLNHIGIELGKEDTEDAKKLLVADDCLSAPVEPPCPACGGTLKNSKGGDCTPCRNKLPSKLFAAIPEMVCGECGGIVYNSPSGAVCDERHGGVEVAADSAEGIAAIEARNGKEPKRPKLHVAEPPMIPGRFCQVCKLPVHRTPSGDLCMNGHLDGPAPSDGPEDEEAPPATKGKKRKSAKVPTGGIPISGTAPAAPKPRPGIMDGFTK